jgi:hypothetical protein
MARRESPARCRADVARRPRKCQQVRSQRRRRQSRLKSLPTSSAWSRFGAGCRVEKAPRAAAAIPFTQRFCGETRRGLRTAPDVSPTPVILEGVQDG